MSTTTRPVLRRGSRGSHVRDAQSRLHKHGFRCGIDSVFGKVTEDFVKRFQRAKGLKADGVVGRQTWAALLALTRAEMTAKARTILATLGWRVNTDARFTQAVRDYQRMYNLGAALSVDGVVGPKTYAALTTSASRRAKGQGDISAHFSAVEFRCKCGGRYSDCRRIWAHRALVQGAERYRTLVGPFTPVSACRCKRHNAAVKGYSRSQHLHGTAMDVAATQHVDRVKGLRAFPALGINRGSRTVRHVDFRNLSPDNYPRASGSTTSPYVYYYG